MRTKVAVTSPYGKRFSMSAAATYLDMGRAQLRALVVNRRITFARAESGRVQFLQKDLDAFIESQRVVHSAPARTAVDSPRTSVDEEMAAFNRRIGAEPIW